MIPAEERPRVSGRDLVAPMDRPSPWAGHRPWERHSTEVVIPVINPSDTLLEVVSLLRLQTVRPYIVLVDTGSDRDELRKLEAMRAWDLEVHQIASGGLWHPSAVVAVALDLGMSLCRTEVMLMTHQDCFLRSRTAVEELEAMISPASPVVGYEITPRKISDWQGMIGHTWSGIHVPTCRKAGLRWGALGGERGQEFDTEYRFCREARRAGLPIRTLGGEVNYARNVNRDFDHVRSWPSARLYSPEHEKASLSGIRAALREARERMELWQSQKES